jgi:GT2 family glycosyltransferase
MTTRPDVSVIVPTRDRPGQLARCLGALARLELDGRALEVVVVDDGSDTPVELGQRPGLRALRLRGAGPAAARNAGAAAARAPVLAFTDDDCEPERDWLRVLASRLAGTPGAVVGGRAVNAVGRNRCAAASQLLLDYLHGYYNLEPDDARFLTSNNLAVRAGDFARLGGFDESFGLAGGEDRELGFRARRLGHPLVYEPRAVVRHHHRLSPRGFVRQHFRYGRGAARFRQASGLSGLRLEPLAFYGNLVAYPWRRRPRGGEVALSGLLALSQVANAAGFAYEQVSAR